jgi:stage V sporulation protein B
MQQGRRFALDVSWVLVSSAVNLVLGFVLRIVLARWLGSFDLGLYTLVLTVQELAILVAGMGVAAALTKYIAEYRNDKDTLSRMVYSGFTVTAIFSLIGALLLYFLASPISGFFSMPELAHLLRILAFSLPFTIINQSLLGLENGLRRMNYYAGQLMIRSFLIFTSTTILTLLGYGVEGTVYGIVISMVATSAWGLYVARKFLHFASGDIIKHIRKLTWFGFQIFGTSSANYLLTYADTIMIGFFLSATEVGYYSIAVTMGVVFTMLPQAIQQNTFPMTAQYWYEKNYSALKMMVDKSMKYAAVVLLPLGLLFAFFAEDITTKVFGAEYIASVSPFLILLIAKVIRGATFMPIGASFSSIGRPDISLKLNSLELVMDVLLNWLLIPRYGITGAAAATATSLLIGTLISINLLPKLQAKLDYKWYGAALGLAGAAYVTYWGVSKLINHYAVGSVLFIGYCVLILRVFLTVEDREFFKSLLSPIFHRSKKNTE